MQWWFVYGDLLHQQYRNERLQETENEALVALARGQSDTKRDFLDLLALILAFVNFHSR